MTKSRFDEIQSIVTEAKSNKLKTNVGKKVVKLNSMEELIKELASRKIKSKKEAKHRFNAILDKGISKIAGLNKYTKNQNKILYIFRLLKEIFIGYKADDKTNERDDKTDE